MSKLRVRFIRLRKTQVPLCATTGSAGYDLYAADEAVIEARGYGLVGTGIALEMPPGVEAQVRPRSGLAATHGVGILNSPGTVDSDYRGEVKVVLFNFSDVDFRVRPGDRIAQLVFSRALDVDLDEVADLSATDRGDGGFGHTG
uniref:dUTP diphosphatase n=1 Tax=candidate division WOR-3 bacterium TaxID=2052148 RepID=A0A7C4CDF1_UNCW3